MPESASQKLMSKTQCKIVPRRKSMISEPARAQCANESHTFLYSLALLSPYGHFFRCAKCMQKSATSLAKDGQRNDAAIGEVRWKYATRLRAFAALDSGST